jgi:hypothetical protein
MRIRGEEQVPLDVFGTAKSVSGRPIVTGPPRGLSELPWVSRRLPNEGFGPRGRVEDERLTELIRQVHRENYDCYSQQRIWRELRRRGRTLVVTGSRG